MVRHFLRLIAALPLILCVSACGLLLLSPFPTTLSQVVARADLSSLIPSGTEADYGPVIVTPTGGEFVLLMNRTTTHDPIMIALDSKLNVIQSYTLSQLNGWAIGPYSGSMAMTDGSGSVAIGNYLFTAADLATVGQAASTSIGVSLTGPGFCSLTLMTNYANFQISGGNTFTYSKYSPIWTFLATSGAIQISAAGGNFRVLAVYNVDDTPAAGEVVVVFCDQGNDTNVYFVSIPLVDINTVSVLSPVFSNYPYKALSNIDPSSIGFAGDCLVVYNQDSHALVRYSTTAPFKKLDELPQGETNDKLHTAYKMEGDYSVIYNEEKRILTKVANWW